MEKDVSDELMKHLGVCGCQRKVKSIVDVLMRIHDKVESGSKEWTAEEYLIVAFLDSAKILTHGINIEYPMLSGNGFWEWLKSIKDGEHLIDG